MNRPGDFRVEEKGSAFFIVTLLAIAATVIVGAHLSTSLGKVRYVEAQVEDSSAFNAAESGLNTLIEAVWTAYRLAPVATRLEAVDRLDGKFAEEDRLEIDDRRLGRSSFQGRVRTVLVVDNAYADVEIVAVGENRGSRRALTAVVRYGRQPSQVFNHAYFINNFGWLWGSSITVNGSVRSNGNFSLRGATVNGEIVACENSELGAAGTIEGDSKHLSLEAYRTAYGDQARPTNPTANPEDLDGDGEIDPGEDRNENGVLDDFAYAGGYSGESERLPGQGVVNMPYLGDLSIYRGLATRQAGSLTLGGQVVVDRVLGDNPGEATSLVLVGTTDAPIVINGPVVIEGDVVLKGVITGRGTIYAGRNVHIVGNLEYLDPPVWPKPSDDPEAVREANVGKDLIGLAAKGSVILGDYTADWWKSSVGYYQKPPFTQPYTVDPTDKSNGYVSYTDGEGRPVFNGDYTALDGGVKATSGNTSTTPRRFYESSFPDDEVHALAAAEYVTRVDAVIYTNHLLSGRIGSCTFNGTLVSRDEAMIYSSSLVMNYDVRVRNNGYEYIDIFLPREPAYRVLYFQEGSPE